MTKDDKLHCFVELIMSRQWLAAICFWKEILMVCEGGGALDTSTQLEG
jgi:hypothetical protein